MSTRNKDKVQKAARKIECLLNEEKEYKHKELELINSRLKQTEAELDKLRSYLLGCYYTDEPTSVTLEGPAKSSNIEADDTFSSKRLIIGNVSKYITADQRENINDRFIYKWLLYLRTPPDCKVPIESFVSKVHFTLDPSYIPNHEVELTEPPFEVRRRGWGEFAVKVKIFFKHQSQPVEVTHQLTLDTTFSGVQTPGSETIVDIEFSKDEKKRST